MSNQHDAPPPSDGDESATPPTPRSDDKSIVVGIGASAGGLQALQDFFDALPGDDDLSFVVITHMDPERESMLPELLQSHTAMPVRQVQGKVAVELNHVYVIPPNRRIVITDTHLSASQFEEPRGHRKPIDYFFRSLADVHRNAAAVILSGGGTDGAVGVKAIKEAGGLLLVQDPDEAEHDGMPRAAIATGLADVVAPVRELAARLIEYQRHTPLLPEDPDALTRDELETLHSILTEVQSSTGHDFSQYKRSTLLRRIQRRLQLNGYVTLGVYLDYLRHESDEARALFNDLLIGVTNFFRDGESWAALAEQVVPQLFKGKRPDDTVRAWTIGCSTGEEAYSVAMLLLEHAATLNAPPNIQVFASDLDDAALVNAREGYYPAAIEADVSPERLQRFFRREEDYYRVRRELRDAVLFTRHSVLRDPPFSRLGLISCRNLLIYLQRDLQDMVFDIFHYALDHDGYLFLGSSETADGAGELFHPVDKSHRIYQARPWHGERPHVPMLPLTVRHPLSTRPGAVLPAMPPTRRQRESVAALHREMLEAHSPPSVLIDADYQILHVSETAGRYLLQPVGPITSDLLTVVRPEMQNELRAALVLAFTEKRPVISEPVFVRFNGQPRRVILSVLPRTAGDESEADEAQLALVVFLEHRATEWVEPGEPGESEIAAQPGEADQAELSRLEAEVARLRERLQRTAEEYETSNEELRATNEELQSINEEYRSTTEELETSKEELQSVNEELQTVNNELKNKLDEISRAHSDLENLMAATDIATVFLDRQLRVQRYTPRTVELINIMPADRGRPIEHLTHRLQYADLAADAGQVLKTLVPIEREVRGPNHDWFLVRLRPYRTVDDRIDGVVITLVNISQLKQTEEELRAAIDYSEKIVDTVREGLLVLQPDLTVEFANQSFYEMFEVSEADTIGTIVYALGNGQWDIPALRRLLEDVLPENNVFNDYEIEHTFATIGRRTMVLNGRRLDHVQLILLAIEDVAERRRAIDELHRLNETLEEQVQHRTQALERRSEELQQARDHFYQLFHAQPVPSAITRLEDGLVIDANAAFLNYFDYDREDVVGRTTRELKMWLPAPERQELVARLRDERSVDNVEMHLTHPSGEPRTALASIQVIDLDGEEATISSFIDITERKQLEEELAEARYRVIRTGEAERLRLAQELHDGPIQMLHALNIRLGPLLEAAEHDAREAQLAGVHGLLQQTVSELREMMAGLRPSALKEFGLAGAIRSHVDRLQQVHPDLSIELDLDEGEDLPQAVRLALFRVCEQLLYNVVQHAEADQVRVAFKVDDEQVMLEVHDDGQGFEVPDHLRELATRGHFGLLGAAERAESIGGYMTIESVPNDGTVVRVHVPRGEMSDADA